MNRCRVWHSQTFLACLTLVALICAGCSSVRPSAIATSTVSPTATNTPLAIPPLFAAAPPRISAHTAYLVDPGTRSIIYSLHADAEVPMASTTKIMTAVVAIIAGDLDRDVVTGNDITTLTSDDASVVCCPTMVPGEHFSLRDLLYGLLLPSGADAGLTIADSVAGSQAAFVIRMNTIAAWLHLTHTHFVNVHGLPAPGHYSSASDLERLTEFAMTFPVFRTIVSTTDYEIPANATHPAIKLGNTNELLTTGTALGLMGIDGVKTGFTAEAGYCLVLDARQKGHEIIVVVLGEPDSDTRFADAANLLKWAFAQFPHA